jgi:GMP synthase (glutamine-hydrolysing)
MHILYLVNALDSPPGVLLEEATRQGAAATQIDTVNRRDMTTGWSTMCPKARTGSMRLSCLAA